MGILEEVDAEEISVYPDDELAEVLGKMHSIGMKKITTLMFMW